MSLMVVSRNLDASSSFTTSSKAGSSTSGVRLTPSSKPTSMKTGSMRPSSSAAQPALSSNAQSSPREPGVAPTFFASAGWSEAADIRVVDEDQRRVRTAGTTARRVHSCDGAHVNGRCGLMDGSTGPPLVIKEREGPNGAWHCRAVTTSCAADIRRNIRPVVKAGLVRSRSTTNPAREGDRACSRSPHALDRLAAIRTSESGGLR